MPQVASRWSRWGWLLVLAVIAGPCLASLTCALVAERQRRGGCEPLRREVRACLDVRDDCGELLREYLNTCTTRR